MQRPARLAAPLALTAAAAMLPACASRQPNEAAAPPPNAPANTSSASPSKPEARLVEYHTTRESLGTPATIRVRDVEYFQFGESARTSIRFRYNPWDWNNPCAPSTVVTEMVNASPKIEFAGVCPLDAHRVLNNQAADDEDENAIFILHVTKPTDFDQPRRP